MVNYLFALKLLKKKVYFYFSSIDFYPVLKTRNNFLFGTNASRHREFWRKESRSWILLASTFIWSYFPFVICRNTNIYPPSRLNKGFSTEFPVGYSDRYTSDRYTSDRYTSDENRRTQRPKHDNNNKNAENNRPCKEWK